MKKIIFALLGVFLPLAGTAFAEKTPKDFSAKAVKVDEPRLSALDGGEMQKPPYRMPRFELYPGFPQDKAEQFYKTMDAIGILHGAGASRLHQEVFGRMEGQSYLDYLGRTVHVFRFDPDPGDGHTVAYVFAVGDMVHLKPLFFSTAKPLVFRMSTLLHEARHATGSPGPEMAYPHIDCPSPLLDDQGRELFRSDGEPMGGTKGACDNEALGSYGVELIFLSNMAEHCSNCNGKMKLDASMEFSSYYNRLVGKARREIRADIGNLLD